MKTQETQKQGIAVIGIDLAKSVFQIHGTDARGKMVLRRQLQRANVLQFFAKLTPCLIGMEACGGAHYWARELRALGHTVKLMAPQFVKPYVKTNKNDRADAEAIAEAVTRPAMRFVAVKEVWQQDLLMEHRVRERRIKARTALTNQFRGILAEYGIVIPKGAASLQKKLLELFGSSDKRLSPDLDVLLQRLYTEWLSMDELVEQSTKVIKQASRKSEMCQKLEKLPGVGPIISTAMVATIGNASAFKNARQVPAHLGLVPRHTATGGKTQLKGISKRGDVYMRKMLIHGARSLVKVATKKRLRQHAWIANLKDRSHFNVACVAQANRMARHCWAIMAGRTPRETTEPQDGAMATRTGDALPTALSPGSLRSQRRSAVDNASRHSQ